MRPALIEGGIPADKIEAMRYGETRPVDASTEEAWQKNHRVEFVVMDKPYASPAMRKPILKYWEAVRASYWFVPSLMSVGAIGLSFATTAIDEFGGAELLDDLPWLYANRPEGARALLSTIAGSMITVAGVIFSITIAAVAYATSQFGPRLLTNFMRDTKNQVALGTFIATFLYCLLVLRAIRSPAPGQLGVADNALFVPHVAILCGLVMTLLSVAMLIFYIHHVPASIHASNVVAELGGDLRAKIGSLYPRGFGREPPRGVDPEADLPPDLIERSARIRAAGNGYLQHIRGDALLGVAGRNNLVVRIAFRPGDFVNQGATLAWAWPHERVSEEVEAALHGSFVWGAKRSPAQDALFLANELVEIATRALSPGVNDPYTAMACMNWLSTAIVAYAPRELPAASRYDERGALRVITRPVNLADFADVLFGQLRPYVQADRNAALHMMKILADLSRVVEAAEDRQVLRDHALALQRGAAEACDRQSAEVVAARGEVVLALLAEGADYEHIAAGTTWVGGAG